MSGSPDNGTWDYTYDDAGRLQTAKAPDGVITTYGYDVAGNRTSVDVDGSETTYSYDPAGRLTSSSDGAAYDHDPAGNLISITGGQQGTWTYTYDALSRMTSAEGGTQSITYGLDVLGRTVSRTSAGSTTTYFYQDLSEQPVQVSGPSGTTDIVWALGEPLVQKQGGATRFFGTTPHGDVAYLADDTGTIQGTRTYSPFGEVRSATGEDSTLGYQSDLTDPDSNLVDMGARQYHPGLGRFTSSDPLQGDPDTPLSMNSHLYAHADPLGNADPTGLVTAPIGAGGSEKVGVDDDGDPYVVNSPSDPNTLPGHGWEAAPVPPAPQLFQTSPRRAEPLPNRSVTRAGGIFQPLVASLLLIHRAGGAIRNVATTAARGTSRFARNIRTLGSRFIGLRAKIGLSSGPRIGTNDISIGPRTPQTDLSSRGIRPAPGTRVRPEGIPNSWKVKGTRQPGGIRYYDPRNPGNSVRIMQGNPASPWRHSRSPYVRWQRHGQPLDVRGNPLPHSQLSDAHIPLGDFRFLPEVFQ